MATHKFSSINSGGPLNLFTYSLGPQILSSTMVAKREAFRGYSLHVGVNACGFSVYKITFQLDMTYIYMR